MDSYNFEPKQKVTIFCNYRTFTGIIHNYNWKLRMMAKSNETMSIYLFYDEKCKHDDDDYCKHEDNCIHFEDVMTMMMIVNMRTATLH